MIYRARHLEVKVCILLAPVTTPTLELNVWHVGHTLEQSSYLSCIRAQKAVQALANACIGRFGHSSSDI